MSDPDTASTQGAPARATAARIVERVVGNGQTLDSALAAELRGGSGEEDTALVQALAFGALRWHHRYRFVMRRLLHRPVRPRDRVLEALISVGLFQLEHGRQPAYAAVSATVAAARVLGQPRAAGLVNAALRRFQRDSAALGAAVEADAVARWSHPRWLIERLHHDWPDRADALLQANQAHPPLWLRVNRLRASRSAYAARLHAELGLDADAPDAFPDALRLARPVPVTRLPGFADGLVSVQDAAAQMAAELLAAAPGMRVLDACAAPGGKAAHLLERAGGPLELDALDKDPSRLALVQDTLARLGLEARVREADVLEPERWWDGRAYDRILIDAPCSATGVIRRHPDIKLLRRPTDLEPLARRQRAMLERLWPLLAPGGRLLYATCSVLRTENHDVMRGFLAETPDACESRLVPGPAMAALVPDTGPGYQLLPGPGDTDGFYYGLIERRRPDRDGPAPGVARAG